MNFPETDRLIQELKELEARIDEASDQEARRELCLKAQESLTRYSLETWRKMYRETLPEVKPEENPKEVDEDFSPPY